MVHCLSTLAALCVVFASAAVSPLTAAEHEYAIHSAKSQSIRAVYDFEIHQPNLTAKEWVVFVTQLPTLVRQGDVQTQLRPAGDAYRDLSLRHRALLRARVPATNESLRHTFRAQVDYAATLYSRHLVERKPGEAAPTVRAPSAAEREASLATTTTLDYENAEFQSWLKKHKLHRRRQESELDFGRRIFLHITRSLKYDYAEKMDRHASHLCDADAADCGGMSVLFVSAMRANDIPARVLAGRWAKSSVPDAQVNGVVYNQQHVKAEFFVTGLGWVPVDLSSAVVHDKTDAGLEYFGHDRGDFVVMHVDPDFTVDTVHFGEKSFTFMQGFHYWVTGSGKLDGETMKLRWTVNVDP